MGQIIVLCLLAAAVGVIIGVGAILFTWWKRK